MDDIIYLELSAANVNCRKKFTDISKVLYKGKPIFEYAVEAVNNSAAYKRCGRKLEIEEINDFFIRVSLYSRSSLEWPSKSLSGFARTLLNADMELNSEIKLFKDFYYNRTLFRSRQTSKHEVLEEAKEISDIDALKLCVELFCGSIVSGKREKLLTDDLKNNIKKLLKDYEAQLLMIKIDSEERRLA